jgi:hypothetical protein
MEYQPSTDMQLWNFIERSHTPDLADHVSTVRSKYEAYSTANGEQRSKKAPPTN